MVYCSGWIKSDFYVIFITIYLFFKHSFMYLKYFPCKYLLNNKNHAILFSMVDVSPAHQHSWFPAFPWQMDEPYFCAFQSISYIQMHGVLWPVPCRWSDALFLTWVILGWFWLVQLPFLEHQALDENRGITISRQPGQYAQDRPLAVQASSLYHFKLLNLRSCFLVKGADLCLVLTKSITHSS